MNYKGEKQQGDHCVFASVGQAVNAIAGKTHWNQWTLLQAYRDRGNEDKDLNFGNLVPVAVEPAKADVKFRQHVDSGKPISDADYLKSIKDCIDRGGIAIVSMEVADLVGSSAKRLQGWHMLSLVSRKDNDFQAWDTLTGKMRTVTANELVTHLPWQGRVLAVHDKHDVLLIEPI